MSQRFVASTKYCFVAVSRKRSQFVFTTNSSPVPSIGAKTGCTVDQQQDRGLCAVKDRGWVIFHGRRARGHLVALDHRHDAIDGDCLAPARNHRFDERAQPLGRRGIRRGKAHARDGDVAQKQRARLLVHERIGAQGSHAEHLFFALRREGEGDAAFDVPVVFPFVELGLVVDEGGAVLDELARPTPVLGHGRRRFRHSRLRRARRVRAREERAGECDDEHTHAEARAPLPTDDRTVSCVTS